MFQNLSQIVDIVLVFSLTINYTTCLTTISLSVIFHPS